MRKSQFLLSLIFVLSSVIPSYGAMQQFTKHGWNLLVDVEQGRLSISHTQLGVVIEDVILNLQKEGRLTPLSDWDVEDRDTDLLAVTTSNPAASTWEFVVAPSGIAVRSSAANSVIAGIAPAPVSRFPARIAEPDKMQSSLSDEDTDYTGAKLYEKMYVPGEASDVMYLALGLVEARNLHALFDRPSDTVIQFSAKSRLKRNLKDSTRMEVSIPAYMSPEAWRGEPSTLRSDVYSFGALLYALGAGAPPHRGDSPEIAQEAALACDAPSLAVAAPGIDARFVAIVDRCLRRDPAERFASGDDVREALETLAADDAPAVRVLAQAPHVRPALLPRRAALGVVLALALVLAFFAYPNDGGEPSRLPVHAAPAPEATPEAPAQRSPDPPAQMADARSVGVVPGGCPEGMVPVPAGTFHMGSPEGEGGENEHPQHEVTLSAYCIDRTEVTVAAYVACVADRHCSAALHTVNWTGYTGDNVKIYSGWCNREDRPDHPINCIDWDQAKAYCTWKGKRLPTEAEWEYAARGSDGRAYPWGNEAPSAKRLNACDSQCIAVYPWPVMFDGNDGWGTTAPVGSYPEGVSPFGALDMAGNVWEWTADWYGVYAMQAQTNPPGPSTGTSRVVRGGGWISNDATKRRTTDRARHPPKVRDCDVGFRCVRED